MSEANFDYSNYLLKYDPLNETLCTCSKIVSFSPRGFLKTMFFNRKCSTVFEPLNRLSKNAIFPQISLSLAILWHRRAFVRVCIYVDICQYISSYINKNCENIPNLVGPTYSVAKLNISHESVMDKKKIQ